MATALFFLLGNEFKGEKKMVSPKEFEVLSPPPTIGDGESLIVSFDNGKVALSVVLRNSLEFFLFRTFEKEGFLHNAYFYKVPSRDVEKYYFVVNKVGLGDAHMKTMKEIVFMEREC